MAAGTCKTRCARPRTVPPSSRPRSRKRRTTLLSSRWCLAKWRRRAAWRSRRAMSACRAKRRRWRPARPMGRLSDTATGPPSIAADGQITRSTKGRFRVAVTISRAEGSHRAESGDVELQCVFHAPFRSEREEWRRKIMERAAMVRAYLLEMRDKDLDMDLGMADSPARLSGGTAPLPPRDVTVVRLHHHHRRIPGEPLRRNHRQKVALGGSAPRGRGTIGGTTRRLRHGQQATMRLSGQCVVPSGRSRRTPQRVPQPSISTNRAQLTNSMPNSMPMITTHHSTSRER